MSIALWYCPSPGTVDYEVLKTLINSLKLLVPNTHEFEPHLTVVTHLNVKTKADVNKVLQSCYSCQKTVPRAHDLVQFENWSINRQFFKKIVLECKRDRYLLGMAQLMRELYVEIDDQKRRAEHWALEEFKPHVSLMYSDSEITKATQMVIRQRISDTLQLFGDGSSSCWRTFKVVNCEGPVEEWEVLGSITI
ncbi:2',3'-cyclic-nucleotide 3'-phosphodiesterase [Nakaseomyces bracarensis]|uniref:2',3'-cyclic-nucleotide 3'-phosphodiesterase n=1 Tax=Nakaseomyces bracarensis TaxID=273131 RepID=A0ABR4NR20_9SACH